MEVLINNECLYCTGADLHTLVIIITCLHNKVTVVIKNACCLGVKF